MSRAELLARRGTESTDKVICYSEGAALSAVDLEQISGVPRTRFLTAAASGSLSASQARRLVQDHYGVVSEKGPGQELFQTYCSQCHRTTSSISDLGAVNSEDPHAGRDPGQEAGRGPVSREGADLGGSSWP